VSKLLHGFRIGSGYQRNGEKFDFGVLAVGAVSCTLASLEQNLANQGKDRQLFRLRRVNKRALLVIAGTYVVMRTTNRSRAEPSNDSLWHRLHQAALLELAPELLAAGFTQQRRQ
jgi:hypothetical protein